MRRIAQVLVVLLAVAAAAPVAAQQAGTAPQQPPLELSLLAPNAPAQIGGSLLEGKDRAQAGRWYFDLGASGSSMGRLRPFRFGSEIGSASTGSAGFPTVPLGHDTDGPGWGGSASLGYWVNSWLGIEASVSGLVQEKTQSTNQCKLQDTVSMIQMPDISGQNGASGVMDFACNGLLGSPSNGVPTDVRLTYNQALIDGHIDARIRFWESSNKKSALEVVAGIAYLHVQQDFSHLVIGFPGSTGNLGGSLKTDIDLSDNLIGSRVGVRGHHEFAPGWKLLAGVFGDLYARWSEMFATQDGRNVNFDTGVQVPRFNQHRSDSDSGFVPRLEANVSLSYDINQSWTLGLFYKFDGLWKMTALREPNMPSDCNAVLCTQTGTLDIRNNDRLFVHTVGLGVTGRF